MLPSSKTLILALIAGLSSLFCVSDASAQFMPYYGGSPFVSNAFYRQNHYLYYSTPYGGYSLSFSRYQTLNTVTPYPVLATRGLSYRGVIAGPMMYGSATSNAPSWDQYTLNLQKAQRNNRVDPVGRQVVFDQWIDNQGAKGIPAEKMAQLPENIRLALAMPKEADILSGKALNLAVVAIRDMEARKVQAKPPFFTADTLVKANFAGGVPADTLNVFLQEIVLPESVSNPEIEGARATLIKDFTTISESLRSNKKPDVAAFEQLSNSANKLRELYRLTRASEQAITAVTMIETAANTMTDKNYDNLLPASWVSLGVNVSDLVRAMGKYKVEFGPARKDDDGGYRAIYRGLNVYLSELAQSK